jgi:hypothetical protein
MKIAFISLLVPQKTPQILLMAEWKVNSTEKNVQHPIDGYIKQDEVCLRLYSNYSTEK